MQCRASGRRPQKVILPPCLPFLLCLRETSVLGTAPALLVGFKSEGKVFISVDLRLCPYTHAVKQIISHQRAEGIEEEAGSLYPSPCITS